MYFKDRIVEFPNRKKLNVEDVKIGNNGQIEEMLVYVNRDEGNIEEEGTPLSADALNQKFDTLYESLGFILKNYFTSYLNNNWDQDLSRYQYENFYVQLKDDVPDDFSLYAKVHIPHLFLTSLVTRYNKKINIMIYETKELNDTRGSFTRNLDFYVELYQDVECTKFITRLKGLVKYRNTSTNPID